MTTGYREDSRPRLTRAWRRALVVTASTCAAMTALLQLAQHIEARPRYSLTLALGLVVLSCLWLLVDTVWPWVGGDGVRPEERAHADTALRRAYGFLFGVAVAVLLYLQLVDARPDLLPTDPRQGTVILWTLVTLIVLTPVAISAWTDVDDGVGTRPVGPIGLLKARFGGKSGGLYIGGMGMLLAAVPLAMVGTRGESARGPAESAAVIGGLGIVAAVAAILARIVMKERRGARHERR